MAKPLKTKDELKAATLEELEKEQAYFEKRKAAEKSAAAKELDELDPEEFFDPRLSAEKRPKKYEPVFFGEEDMEKDDGRFDGFGEEFLNVLGEGEKILREQTEYEERIEYEKLEYLNIKEARDKKYALEQELAKLKAQAKKQTKEAGTVAIVASGRKGGSGSVVEPELQKRIEVLEKEISDLNKNITLAGRIQEKKYLYSRAKNANDF